MKFIDEFCEEISGENIPLREFTNVCNEYLKSKHLRILTANQTGKILREEGFAVGSRKINDISMVVILNLTIKTTKTIISISQNPCKETTETLDSFKGFNSFEQPIEIIKINRSAE